MKRFVAFGIAVVTLATVCGLGRWLWVTNAYSEVQSILRVRRPDSLGTNTPMSSQDFNLFKQTQADLLSSTFVLNRTVEGPVVSELRKLGKLEDPGRLRDSLAVESSEGTEIIFATLRIREDEDDAKWILDAIVDTYLKEIVRTEVTSNTRKLSSLRSTIDDVDRKLTDLRSERERLERSHSPDDKVAADNARLAAIDEEETALITRKHELSLEIEDLQGIRSGASSIELIQPARATKEDAGH
jgi:hypothetical protein